MGACPSCANEGGGRGAGSRVDQARGMQRQFRDMACLGHALKTASRAALAPFSGQSCWCTHHGELPSARQRSNAAGERHAALARCDA